MCIYVEHWNFDGRQPVCHHVQNSSKSWYWISETDKSNAIAKEFQLKQQIVSITVHKEGFDRHEIFLCCKKEIELELQYSNFANL